MTWHVPSSFEFLRESGWFEFRTWIRHMGARASGFRMH